MKRRGRHRVVGDVTLPGDAAQQSGDPVGPGGVIQQGSGPAAGDAPLQGDAAQQGGNPAGPGGVTQQGSGPEATADPQSCDLQAILAGLVALGLGENADGGDVSAEWAPAAQAIAAGVGSAATVARSAGPDDTGSAAQAIAAGVGSAATVARSAGPDDTGPATTGALADGAGTIPATLAQDLHRYVKELKLWNPRLGLIEATEAEILPKHIWDSLGGVPVFRAVTENLVSTRLGSAGGKTQSLVVADLGSGAGLPGLVLSLAIPQTSQGVSIRWVLVEKSGRRVNFLRNCKALIPRAPIEIDPSSFEDIPPESFNVVTNRAFQPLSLSTFAQQSRLVREGGWILWYKGKFDAVVEEGHALGRKVRVVTSLKEALELDFGTELGAWPLEVPGLNAQRHILMWKKAQTQN